MKILITGATGFVGTQLTQRWLDEEHEIRILRRSHSDISKLEEVQKSKGLKSKGLLEHHIGDIIDPKSLLKATQGVSVVCHLAGVVGYSKAMRATMEKVNVYGTQNVINACLKNNVQRLIHMSSVVAVGASFKPHSPLNEESFYNLSHLNLSYFETKRQAEQLVVQAVQQHQLNAVILNPSTIYGPGDAKKGSRGIQLKIAKGQFPFYTSGGVNVVSVEDVIHVISSALHKGQPGERYIISGENMLIKELFQAIAKEAGTSPPSIYLPNPVVHAIGCAGDLLEKVGKRGPLNSENAWASTLYHWFDSTKAQKEFDFKPRPSQEAIAQSVQWIKENMMNEEG